MTATPDPSGRRARAAALVRELAVDALLVADPGSVAWLTGHEAAIDTGPSPFAIGPFALVDAAGAAILFASEDETVPDGVEVCRYAGFTVEPLDRLQAARTVTDPFVDGRRLAIEAGVVPAGLVAGARSWIDAERSVLVARAVKDADEIELIRAAVELCDAGQAAVRGAAAAGVTELELWSAARGAIDGAAGSPTPLLADLVSGPRTAGAGGPPGERPLSEGDLVLCDLVPRRAGMWGDSCATFAVGEPSAWARQAHRRCRDALDAAIDAVRPGVVAGDLDHIVRAALPGLPHHVGHGIGGSAHEEPRIVPGGETRLEAGMVVALEPGLYGEDEGVRVERVVVVVEDGCELLSGHDLTL
jgi:Xaa-Pro aminopeptidase